nr:hypothetical protein Itr_chr13CG06060 [Ipomoea trifida]
MAWRRCRAGCRRGSGGEMATRPVVKKRIGMYIAGSWSPGCIIGYKKGTLPYLHLPAILLIKLCKRGGERRLQVPDIRGPYIVKHRENSPALHSHAFHDFRELFKAPLRGGIVGRNDRDKNPGLLNRIHQPSLDPTPFREMNVVFER